MLTWQTVLLGLQFDATGSTAMDSSLFDDPEMPPPGQRSGAGAASVLTYLFQSRCIFTRPAAAKTEQERPPRKDSESAVRDRPT
jgi:hypothetical protein